MVIVDIKEKCVSIKCEDMTERASIVVKLIYASLCVLLGRDIRMAFRWEPMSILSIGYKR